MIARRNSHHWLPFTQMRQFDPTRTFVRGVGNDLYDAQGRRLFDAVSSIWTTVHGHGHPRIVAAIARQAALLDHATALGATNPVAEALAERLCALLGMEAALFAGDGASAIEAALKIALQFWQNVGQPERRRFVHLDGSYHGDTVGAMSVSDIARFKARFAAITFEARSYDDPAAFADDVAAVVVEPRVQAAAGMRLIPERCYAALRGIAPLIVVDEIATGFGRTGTMFAHAGLDLQPDIVAVGKGLTGGALALSATVVTARVYHAFLGADDSLRHLFHGHSYAGNPIACAAALASLDAFEEEATLDRVAGIARRAEARIGELRVHPAIAAVRAAGTMIGIELEPAYFEGGAAVTPGWQVARGLYARGHFTRPIGNVVQLVPPLASRDEEIDAFFDALLAELER